MSEIRTIYSRFLSYAKDFQKLAPSLAASYFHVPAALIASDNLAFMNKVDEVEAVFGQLFALLEHENFSHSTLDNVSIKQVSENQAIVSGNATRYRKDGSILEHFGLSYTMRKVQDEAEPEKFEWQIVVGVLHDPCDVVFAASVA